MGWPTDDHGVDMDMVATVVFLSKNDVVGRPTSAIKSILQAKLRQAELSIILELDEHKLLSLYNYESIDL